MHTVAVGLALMQLSAVCNFDCSKTKIMADLTYTVCVLMRWFINNMKDLTVIVQVALA